MFSCSPRLTPGRVLPEYYNAGEKGKIAEGKFDLKKLKEEQKRNTLLPAQKVNQESFKTKVPLSYHEHSPEAGCAPPCCGHETHLLQRRGALPGTLPERRSQRLPPRRLHPGQQERLPDGFPAPPQGHGPLRGGRGPLPPGPYIYSNSGNERFLMEISGDVLHVLSPNSGEELVEELAYTANELNQYTRIEGSRETPFVPHYDSNGNQTLIKTATYTMCQPGRQYGGRMLL